jgi:RNA polymerase sigma factor
MMRGGKPVLKRIFGKTRTPEAVQLEPSLNELIAEVQSGDMVLRNRLLEDYQPFVAKCASKLCKRYIDPTRDDEFSIALSAFNEAMDHFSPAQGSSFLTFAETVIRRRLIDFIRKEQKYRDQIPLTSFEVEDEESQRMNPVEIQASVDRYDEDQQAEDRRLEIIQYSQILKEYGITMKDLVEGCPKHSDSRNMLLRIGRLIAERSEWASHLKDKKTLPIKELLTEVQVARKTLERNRKYIIAVAVIQMDNFHHLREYLYIPEGS